VTERREIGDSIVVPGRAQYLWSAMASVYVPMARLRFTSETIELTVPWLGGVKLHLGRQEVASVWPGARGSGLVLFETEGGCLSPWAFRPNWLSGGAAALLAGLSASGWPVVTTRLPSAQLNVMLGQGRPKPPPPKRST
jgi:hypothetical protein